MKILFLGASNTDCRHCFTPDNLGDGYVKRTKELLEASGIPTAAVNGGTDGFTFLRIYRKWQANWRNASFDVVSILGGINEVGALMDSGRTAAQRDAYLADSADALAQLLDGILSQPTCTKSASAQASIQSSAQTSGMILSPLVLVLEPFLFDTPEYLRTWMPCLEDVRHMIRVITADAALRHPACPVRVPHTQSDLGETIRQHSRPVCLLRTQPILGETIRQHSRPVCLLRTQPALDEAVRQHGISAVTTDGIHLAPLGHQCLARLIARELSRGLPKTAPSL